MRWVYGSDELYLLAGATLPPVEYYGDLPQIENGVGAVSALRDASVGVDARTAAARSASESVSSPACRWRR